MIGSAMNDDPPSPTKLALIRRFLILNGSQAQIDTGMFLEQYAMPLPGRIPAGFETATINQALAALKAAYEKHRPFWQEEYERHTNWEFTEPELEAIVASLESPAGAHFLEGRWRMDAYVGSNTEHLVEAIIAEAQEALRDSAT